MAKDTQNDDKTIASSDAKTPIKKRSMGLGRGLDALFSESGRGTPSTQIEPHDGDEIVRIPIGSIRPHPGQPRRHFDEDALSELSASIAERGVIQPIIVRVSPSDRGYQLVAGERRWRASQRAGLHDIPAIIRDFSDTETLEIALVENIQREDLNAIEEARAYYKLTEDFGHTQDALGRLVGKSRSHVANLLRLLDLPEAVQKAVVENRLTMGHARALIKASDPVALAKRIEDEGLSVRQTERMVQLQKQGAERRGGSAAKSGGSGTDPDIAAVEEHLSDMLGLSVQILHNSGKGGKVALSYSSLDQLDMICQRLSGERI